MTDRHRGARDDRRTCVVAFAVVALAAAGLYLFVREPAPTKRGFIGADAPSATATMTTSSARAMNASERALFEPLDVGAHVIGYEVTAMEGAGEGGLLRVRFVALPPAQGRAIATAITVVVALSPSESAPGPAPAASVGPYAVYYEARPGDEGDGERLARGVSRALARHLDLPAPPLGPYRSF